VLAVAVTLEYATVAEEPCVTDWLLHADAVFEAEVNGLAVIVVNNDTLFIDDTLEITVAVSDTIPVTEFEG